MQTDYLVIGAGAMGMAFTDVILTESDATVTLVDRYHQPGGHWNIAYPYVRLHQPSAFYGVNSRHLGNDRIDTEGWNEGLYELATNSEVCAYFDQVMQQQFLPSGRVRYLPMSEWSSAEGQITSLLSGAQTECEAATVVDASYMNVSVPAMRPPPYTVGPGVTCVPPNELPRLSSRFEHYVVVGAGKTGMDACLFLLKNGLDADRISWVMPRDSWLLDRANIQPGQLFEQSIGKTFVEQTRAIAQSRDIDDLFARMQAGGHLLRLDDTVRPTMYRCATVTQAELTQLRRIANIIRLGRVSKIDSNAITLDAGVVDVAPNTVFIDCSADGLERRPVEEVFQDAVITLQTVRTCQQVFSAAFIAHVELAYDDRSEKNDLCRPVPHPDTDIDFLRTALGNARNAARWGQDPALQTWLINARLDGFSDPNHQPDLGDPAVAEAMRGLGEAAKAADANLQRMLAAIG